jgi:hypothetical protein
MRKGNQSKDQQETKKERMVPSFEDAKSAKGASEEDSEDEFYDVERSDPNQDTSSSDSASAPATGAPADALPPESSFPWKEELEVLVRGGVPMALRGEVYFVLFVFFSSQIKFVSWCMSFKIDLCSQF